jgi:cytochrome c553
MIARTTAALTLALSVALAGGRGAQADGDPAAGKQKAETCLGCHAVEGYFNVYPSYRVPKLGGQSGKYIESALKAYRDGQREHGTMHANAANLSDQDMADIGAWMESFRR